MLPRFVAFAELELGPAELGPAAPLEAFAAGARRATDVRAVSENEKILVMRFGHACNTIEYTHAFDTH